MICKHCGGVMPDEALVCPKCGAETNAGRNGQGVSARRQGRPDRDTSPRTGSAASRTAPSEDMPAVDAWRRNMDRGGAPIPLAEREGGRGAMTQGRRNKQRDMRRRVMVNWTLVITILVVLMMLAGAGAYAYLKFTDPGQLIMARMGKSANANAMWAYGQELLDQGYVDRAVDMFEKAYEKQPERDDLYDRLLQLADAYEAANRSGDAERIYTKLYTEVAPNDVQIYRQMVRLLESQGRMVELSAFLKMAYEKTGEISFRRQREELIPSAPSASKEAGVIKYEQDLQLQSPEGYEIYFIFGDEGLLPEDGTEYTEPLHLGEGTHIVRAVAVSSNMVSDEMRVQYTINLPKPSAPYASLAPGTYERRQRIWLKYIPTDDETLLEQKRIKTDQEKAALAKLKDITIYYTVDGQTPTSNSPIYDGEPFYLPAGKSKVKAVAVNGYGKVSNIMERDYQVKIPFKHFFNEGDNFSEFVILSTSRDEFVRKLGTPQSEEKITEESVNSECVQLKYSWGEARFYMTDKGYILYRVDTSSASMTGPRKTKIGMSETDVTSLYRDMGQTYNQDGGRSIYYESGEKKFAMMYHLDTTRDRIDYIYYRADNGVVTLSYFLEHNKVIKMSIRCDFY